MLNKELHIEQNLASRKQIVLTYYYVNILVCSIWILSPIISVFAICLFLAYFNPSKNTYLFYFFLIAAAHGLVNYTKVPASDLEMYNDTFKLYLDQNILQAGRTILLDPFFYYTSYFVTKLSFGNLPVVALFWTIFTYYTFFYALYEYDKIFQSSNRLRLIFIVFFSFFIGLDFQLSAHLMRQSAALSLAMLGIAMYCRGKRIYRLFFVLAFLTHFSTVIFIPIIFLTRLRKHFLAIAVVVCMVLGYIVSTLNILEVVNGLHLNPSNPLFASITDRAQMYQEKDDGGVTVRLMIEMLLYLLIAIYVLIRAGKLFEKKETAIGARRFLAIYMCFSIFVALIRNNLLLSLRYFFYLYHLSAFAIFTFSRVRSYVLFSFVLLLVFTAPVRYFKGLEASAFIYIDNTVKLMSYNVFDFLSN